MTARKHQFAGAQWTYGKGFDTFAPLRPVIIAQKQTRNDSIGIQSVLNGVVMQDGNTSNMIFNPAQIVHYLSHWTTLEAGTTILTGTPNGIGVSRNPSVFLHRGDTIVIKGTCGLGSLVNPIQNHSDSHL